VGAGIAGAGAIVCVVGCEPVAPVLCREQPAGTSAASIRRRIVFFTPNPRRNAMQFP